jgi:peptide/nickel transport system ATP-binding protein
MSQDLLQIENLSVSYWLGDSWIAALRDFNIAIESGQIYGLVGESGSGKTTVASAVMRYLPANGRLEPGSKILLRGQDLAHRSQRDMQSIWAKDLNLVPQNPGAALNPSLRVGEQLAESVRLHLHLPASEIRQRVIEAVQRVRLPEAETILDRYPHQLSGGQQQRVMIAMALITSPGMLILDEPTTNLDVTTEAAILDLIEALIREEGAGALYITHNLGVVARLCDRALVMYAGEIMEDLGVDRLFTHALNPYTIGLLNSIPRIGQTKRERPLVSIPGHPPSLQDRPTACVYSDRCPLAIEICRSAKPPLEQAAEGHLVRCHRWQEIASGTIQPDYLIEVSGDLPEALNERAALLEARNLTKQFEATRTIADFLHRSTPSPVHAVEDVSLSIRQGRTYGLVGESGSGKTTLARMIIGLTEPTRGEIELLGVDLPPDIRDRPAEVLSQIQMVFQNPQTALNPYLTIGEAIRRPIMKLGRMSRDAANAEMHRLLEAVNLPAEYADRYPSELSGGEKQRIAIARAFASQPALVICDEPVSALDVSVQSAVLNLLVRLQEEQGASYLFISHDLAVVGYLADYVAVMYLGELFEVGYARDLFSPPLHPYTEALISAIPVPDPAMQTDIIYLGDDIPGPSHKPTGCAFHTRCPHKLGAICEVETPPWRDDGDEHYIRCHRTLEELAEIQSYLKASGG